MSHKWKFKNKIFKKKCSIGVDVLISWDWRILDCFIWILLLTSAIIIPLMMYSRWSRATWWSTSTAARWLILSSWICISTWLTTSWTMCICITRMWSANISMHLIITFIWRYSRWNISWSWISLMIIIVSLFWIDKPMKKMWSQLIFN